MDLCSKVIARNEEIAWRIIDGEALLVNPRDSLIYPLNAVGTRIWEMLDAKNSCQDIIAALNEEFAGDKTMLADDVAAFIEGLLSKGLATSAAARKQA